LPVLSQIKQALTFNREYKMAYPKDIKAKEKRKEELEAEDMNQLVTRYYFQKDAYQHFREISYASGRVVRTDKSIQTA
jgi:hypothetical protein